MYSPTRQRPGHSQFQHKLPQLGLPPSPSGVAGVGLCQMRQQALVSSAVVSVTPGIVSSGPQLTARSGGQTSAAVGPPADVRAAMSPELLPRRPSPARPTALAATGTAIHGGVAGGSVVTATAQSPGVLAQQLPVAAVVPQLAVAEQDLSSIHVASPMNCSELGGMHDQHEILDHCRDTMKIVNQLAAVLKGLEEDVDSLRRENRNLRKSMSQANPVPGGGSACGGQQPPGQSSTADAEEKLPVPLPSQRAAAVTFSAPLPPMQPAPQAAAAKVVAQTQEQSVTLRAASPRQSTPPPTARLRVAPVLDERKVIAAAGGGAWVAVAQAEEPQHATPSRGTGVARQHRHSGSSPRFGLTSPQASCAPRHLPVAWSPSGSSLPSDRLAERSPAEESTVTFLSGLHERSMEDESDCSPSPQQAGGAERRQQSTTVAVESPSRPDGQQAHAMEQHPGCANVQVCELPQWDVTQSIWMGKEGEEDRFLEKAQLHRLPKDTFVSVCQAVDGLNRGIEKCPEGVCIAYSAPNQGYFLLYRLDQREQAKELLQLSLHSGQLPSGAQQSVASPRTTVAAQPEVMPGGPLLEAAGMPLQPLQTSPKSSPELQAHTAPPQFAEQSMVPMVQPVLEQGLPVQQSLPVQKAVPAQEDQPVQQTLPLLQQAMPAGAGLPVLASEAMTDAGVHDAPAEPAEESLRVGGEELAEGRLQSAASQAEELLRQSLCSGQEPNAASFDAVIQGLQSEEESTRAEEWLWRALESGVAPNEASFAGVVVAACRQEATERVEDTMMQMLHLRMRPSRELFGVVISMFRQRREAQKVEKWLFNAGQSGWTPEQSAFEAVVTLYAERDCLKAEEWLSRALQTEYRLPDSCYDAVVQGFTRAGNATKANEWLSRMLGGDRTPSDESLLQAVVSLMQAGDVARAEAWLVQLAQRSGVDAEPLYLALYNTAMRAGDIACAERQLVALSDNNSQRTQQVVMAFSERGDVARAKAALDRYGSLGGTPTEGIHIAMLSTCAVGGDAEGAEAASRMLASSGQLSKDQAPLVYRAMGPERAQALFVELGVEWPSVAEAAPGPEVAAATATPQSQLQSIAAGAAVSAGGTSAGGVSPNSAQQQQEEKPATMAASAAGTVPGVVTIYRGGAAGAKAAAKARRARPAAAQR